MKSKIGATVLSTALASGLLLTGTAAQAAEVSDDALVAEETIVASPDADKSVETLAEPATDDSAAALSPAVTSTEAETSEQPVPADSTVDIAPLVEETPAPSVESSPETVAPEVEVSQEAVVPESAAEETTASPSPASPTQAPQAPEQKASDPAASVTKSAAPTSSEPTKESATSFGVVSMDDRWAEVDALLPKEAENWSDAQWEEFENSEAGQEYIRRVEELLAEENSTDDEFELTEEEQAFWDTILNALPEDSFEWDDAQWEEYFRSDAGLDLVVQFLPFIADSIETDEDAAYFQEFLEEVFADDPEQLAYYLELYLGITSEASGGSTNGSETVNEPIASESASPVAENDIKPAGSIGKTIVSKAKTAKKPASTVVADSAESPVLADTGFEGAWAAGLGGLLAIGGAVIVARSRKTSAK